MDVSTGEPTNTSSPKLTSTSKISKESISNQTGSPDISTLSPLGKSRYGRTRKPKISEDFYNIDVIFESVREPKKSPRAPQQIKPVPPPKTVKPKVTQSPNKPKEVTNASTKSPRTSYKSMRFVHITGDDEVLQGGPSSESSFNNDLNSKAIHNFFNEESGMLMLQNTAEIKTENAAVEAKLDIDSLNEDSLNLPSEDVTKVLKIISTRSPDPLQTNTDSKTSFKPALKTYSNKRKNFHKVGVVESFGLPDTPIFPIENEKAGAANEPKRIKNLDVASPTSENDINIVDKKLLDTPWKIASIDTDITESEVLLETSREDSPVNTSCNSEILKSPAKLTRKDVSARPSSSDSKFQIGTNKIKPSPKGSPRILRKQNLAVPKKPVVVKEGSSKNDSKINDVKSPKNKSPRKEKPVILKKSVQVSPLKASKKDEGFTKEEINASPARSPRKRKQPTIEKSPLVELKSPDIPKAVKKQKLTEKVLSENIKSPRKQLLNLQKQSPVLETVHNSKSPKKQMLIGSEKNVETLKSPKSPRKQNLPVTLEIHKEKKIVPKKSLPPIVRKDDEVVSETKVLKREAVSPRKLAKSLRKALTRYSPTKAVPQKRKRSESPKKPVPIQHTENLIVLQENTSPIIRKPRGRPKKISLEANNEPPGVPEDISIKSDMKSNNLENAEPTNAPQRDTRLSLKRSSRLAKPLPEPAEMCNTEIKNESNSKPAEIISEVDDISQEVDEMSLLERKHLNSVDTSHLPESLNVSVKEEKLAEVTEETEPQIGKKRSRTKQAKTLPIHSLEKTPKNKEMPKTEPTASIANVTVEKEPDKIKLGDLMWARIRGFPYWPCLITEDPTTKEFTKDSIKKHLIKMYHVRFFGDRGRRSWVYAPSLMKFTDKGDLKNLHEKIKRKSGNSLVLQSCTIKSNIRLKWETATAEAESLKASTVKERFDFFFDMFASDMEKRKRMIESDAFLEYFEKHKAAKDKSVDMSQNETKSQSLEDRSNSSPSVVETVVKEEETNNSERPTGETKPLLEQDNKTKQANDTEKPEVRNSFPVQKRASKIKERQESHDSCLSESTDTFLKNPWQDIDVSKKLLRTPLNEANSECSLSDTDSLSKSSTNTVVPNSFKAQMTRQKRNHLFRGVPRDRVCQICKKPGEILKCKGPCSGIFHYKCAIARYALEIKEELNEDEGENKHEVTDINGVDSTHLDTFKENVQTNDTKKPVEANEKIDSKENDVIKLENPVAKPMEEHTTKYVTSDAETSNVNNKVEIIYIDCDDSDFEHALTPKVRLTPSRDFGALSLAEQIDLKMKEVMQKLEKKTRYADSTTDYTSSEESSSNLLPPKQKPKNTKRKSLKVKHVTADHISFASSASSEDLICESTNADLNQDTNGPVRISSTESAELKKPKHEKSAPARNESGNRIEKHVTGDVTPQSESSNESNFNKDDFKDFKCGYCIAEVDPPCFVCDKEVSNKNESFRQKCSLHMCGKFYHPGCLKMWPQTQWSLISRPKQKNSDTFVCPVHVCHTCASDDPHAAVSRCTSDKVVKCLRCPATYHTTNYCVPAGTLILSTSQIVCPRHLGRDVVKRGRAVKHARTINTPWCFICSKGGDLICCETCPTSVHTDCLAVNLLEDGTFICEDCETGRFPLYDEIVWVKLGTYRWWPALILFPNEIPDNIRNMPHNKGEFVVKFFGTHDHYWVSRGRVFLFQEGDRGHCSPTKKRVDALFKKSIDEAAAAHQVKKLFKSSKEAEIKTGMKPPPYIRVKVNRPVGNVRLFDGNISNTTSCECDPNQDFPCGPDSDCLNRILLTECDPNICPAKERCNNQRFEKRQYPPLVPYKTQGRGWGLKTLEPIRKGSFVIEYVGEIIDEQEYQRRIRKMHEQKDENYYFLTIDKDRIIDAGPKGNLARFMNHCCQPNCETQKWTVNGDTRVGLFAVEDIVADAELTFNYNLECIGKEKKICKCGAPNCSGFIGVKAKADESQKRPKKNNNGIKKKKRSVTPQVFKSDGPCFICGKNGDVGACHNKICTKFYHLKCVNLEFWPEGKWVCPWHNCNMCTKRTIRCCVKCINSYCPVHSEGNVRYDKLLGFVCSEHDPTKESHELSNQNLTMKNLKNSTALTTEETDVTSTTSDEIDNNGTEQVNKDIINDEGDLQIGESIDLISTESVTSTPIKKDITKFACSLQEFESDLILERLPKLSIPDEQVVEKTKVTTAKRKRGRPKQGSGNTPKRIKLSDQIINEGAAKPKPSFTSPNLLEMPAQNEVKLSTSVPTRHLRTTRNNPSASVERFLKQQNELEKDLPIRKRSKPRSEATL